MLPRYRSCDCVKLHFYRMAILFSWLLSWSFYTSFPLPVCPPFYCLSQMRNEKRNLQKPQLVLWFVFLFLVNNRFTDYFILKLQMNYGLSDDTQMYLPWKESILFSPQYTSHTHISIISSLTLNSFQQWWTPPTILFWVQITVLSH